MFGTSVYDRARFWQKRIMSACRHLVILLKIKKIKKRIREVARQLKNGGDKKGL